MTGHFLYRRRGFITLLGGAAVAWPLAARAQPSPVRPLIGVLSPLSAAAATRNIAAFRSALRDLGYVEGRNMTLALRYADGVHERMAPPARELVALNPDVIVTGAQSGALAAYNATRTIPIVVITPEDPVVSGFAQSIAKPSGNITGTWSAGDDALVTKRLDLLKLAVPGVARVGAILNPDEPNDALVVPRLPVAAKALGMTIHMFEVRDVTKLDDLSAQITRAGLQALFVSQSPVFLSARAQIAAMAARLGLPAVYGWREFAEAGGLMSYGPSLPDMYRQSARLVDRILKGVSRPICRSNCRPATS